MGDARLWEPVDDGCAIVCNAGFRTSCYKMPKFRNTYFEFLTTYTKAHNARYFNPSIIRFPKRKQTPELTWAAAVRERCSFLTSFKMLYCTRR